MTDVDVTIFIRSRNESALIGTCIRAILEQRHPFRVEILVLDSGSTDDTVEIAQQLGAQVFSVPIQLFSYSAALNAGVRLAKGRFFVPLSAHCVPAGTDWLENLISHFQEPMCGAAFSRQIPWPDVSIPEALEISYSFPKKNQITTSYSWKLALSEGVEPFKAAKHSNTAGAYRRDLLWSLPFKEIPFGEDRLLATELLNAGYSIYYAHTSTALHSHYPNFRSFRSVARLATVSRYTINSHASPLFHPPGALCELLAQLKIPLYVLFLSFSIFIPILPGRRNRMRELHWRIASLGTTLGKYEGIKAYRSTISKGVQSDVKIASPNAILEQLGRLP